MDRWDKEESGNTGCDEWEDTIQNRED